MATVSKKTLSDTKSERGVWAAGAARRSPVLHPGVTLASSLRVVLGQEAPAAGLLRDPKHPALAGFLLLRGVHEDVVTGAEGQLIHVLRLVLEQDPQGLEWRKVSSRLKQGWVLCLQDTSKPLSDDSRI